MQDITDTCKLTIEDLHKLKFSTLHDHDFINGCKHASLQGMSASTNPFNNCVTVFTQKKLAPRSTFMGKTEKYGKDWTEYTVVVQGDRWGETRDEIVLPRGANLADAKKKAIEIAELYIKDGQLYI